MCIRDRQTGDIVIAAITSCTNTSNPNVMIAAGLVAKKAINQINNNGLLILESSPREFSISPTRVKQYGDTQLTFWKKEI